MCAGRALGSDFGIRFRRQVSTSGFGTYLRKAALHFRQISQSSVAAFDMSALPTVTDKTYRSSRLPYCLPHFPNLGSCVQAGILRSICPKGGKSGARYTSIVQKERMKPRAL